MISGKRQPQTHCPTEAYPLHADTLRTYGKIKLSGIAELVSATPFDNHEVDVGKYIRPTWIIGAYMPCDHVTCQVVELCDIDTTW